MDAVTATPQPVNEPVGSFAPGSPERARLQAKLAELASTPTEIHHVIGGAHRRGTGPTIDVVQPHRHAAVLGTLTNATATDVPTPSRPPTQPPRAGARCPSKTAPRYSCAPPTCCPARGAKPSPPQRCSASRRPRTRPRSTPRAS